jgi:D-alanyl-lipoteichoic acid acyltransferase DltB (MBOAT superfamily)
MWFNSWEFLLFLPTVLIFYYIFSHRVQNIWLLIASYFFYGWWDWRFLLLIFLSTAVDYFAALFIYNNTIDKKRRLGFYSSIVVNLGLLCVFKYFNFFVDSFVSLSSTIGINLDTPVMRILPPVGISFYTFQAMSYTIDVYRNVQKPAKNFFDFALYVCYFPQLVAGPIERASSLLPQILNKRKVNAEMIQSGMLLILIGFFKKIAIADTAAIGVEEVFSNPSRFSSWFLWKGLYLFSIQLYCDFSGYSNIARGVSKLFGIELMENFQAPYFSKSITEFWRRWHISLSTWFRDYLFIPLNLKLRYLKNGTAISILITFLIIGFWHGAAWTFIVWGFLHGLYLIINRYWSESDISAYLKRIFNPAKMPWIGKFISVLIVFHLVSFAWVFFRSQNFNEAWIYINGIFSFRGDFSFRTFLMPAALSALLIPLDLHQYIKNDVFAIRSWPRLIKSAYYLIIILSIILLSSNQVPFIYFQF